MSEQVEASTLLREIEEASEPVAQFWPMKGFVHHNPIHGLEHLPFDEAVREARHLFGARGYLPNGEYRDLYRSGRISDRHVERALRRHGPHRRDDTRLRAGSRQISASEVQRLHLLCGFEALDPALLSWQLEDGGALERLSEGVPDESRKRIVESDSIELYLKELWTLVLSLLSLRDPRTHGRAHDPGDASRTSVSGRALGEIGLPFQRTVSDWVGELARVPIVDAINDQMIKWVAAFVDEGMAGWEMPARQLGFYPVWRELATHDASGPLAGISRFKQKVRALPVDPEESIHQSLRHLDIPQSRWRDYLARGLAQMPGWTGFIRWRGNNPNHPEQRKHPIDVVHYLAVRLFYEVELSGVESRRHWGVEATLPALVDYWQARPEAYEAARGRGALATDGNLLAVCRDAWRLFHSFQCLGLTSEQARAVPRKDAERLLSWLDDFPADRHGPVWLEAYEDSYRERILGKLSGHRGENPDNGERPRAQAIFCIDVRSESFRRHLESEGPYETLGFAGFFGIPISHRVFDTDESVALCPVLLTPQHAVSELPRSGQAESLRRYASGSRWSQLGSQLFHDLKHNPIAAFVLIDVLGLFFSVRLIGKTLLRRPYRALISTVRRWFVNPVATQIPVAPLEASEASDEERSSALTRGFTIDEQATFVENGLRTMGLTSNFGRFVVLCGHGGNSDNNPYFAALHCGACGGRAGDPNARVFAAMGNNPEVRRLLSERGLEIPDDTWFLGGKHDTNTDRLTLYDLEDVPPSHGADLNALEHDLQRAGARQALERCHRIPGAPRNVSPERAYAHVEARSFDWANPRPEWGLSGNAGFIIGRRTLTKGLDLEGRVFLNSYDPIPDPEGVILEKIMTAPLIVGEWISMEHYFSAADPWNYGSGSKVIHNVVSGVGLMLGSQSDLATGLPLQTVNNGKIHQHEPMRLLAIIEANREVIGKIIKKHEILQQLFHKQWVNLVALDPATFELHRYNPDATWEPVEVVPAERTSPAERKA